MKSMIATLSDGIISEKDKLYLSSAAEDLLKKAFLGKQATKYPPDELEGIYPEAEPDTEGGLEGELQGELQSELQNELLTSFPSLQSMKNISRSEYGSKYENRYIEDLRNYIDLLKRQLEIKDIQLKEKDEQIRGFQQQIKEILEAETFAPNMSPKIAPKKTFRIFRSAPRKVFEIPKEEIRKIQQIEPIVVPSKLQGIAPVKGQSKIQAKAPEITKVPEITRTPEITKTTEIPSRQRLGKFSKLFANTEPIQPAKINTFEDGFHLHFTEKLNLSS